MEADHGEDKEYEDGELQDGENTDTAVAEDGQAGGTGQLYVENSDLPH